MGTELATISDGINQISVKRFYGGDSCGVSVQITGPDGYVQLSASEAAKVKSVLSQFLASQKPSRTTTLAFILTMPNRGSWNGGWSGEGNLYALIKKFHGKKGQQRGVALHGKSWHYSWSDGWGANVQCKIVDGEQLRKIRKQSKGFCGYDWMVESILNHGAIYADHEKPTKEKRISQEQAVTT